MTWTYTPGWLTVSGTTGQMTRVRRLCGDVTTTDQQLTDEEIYWILTEQTSTNYAAADACDLIAGSFLRQCNTDNSLLRVSAAARHKHYMTMADRLRAAGPGETPGGEAAGVAVGEPYAGGTSIADADDLAADTDNILPPAHVGQDDFPSGGKRDADPRNYFSDLEE